VLDDFLLACRVRSRAPGSSLFHANLEERLLHGVQPFGSDNAGNELHEVGSRGIWGTIRSAIGMEAR